MTTAPTPIPHGHAPRRPHPVLLIALAALLAVGIVLLVRHDKRPSSSSGVHGSGVAASVARHVPAFDAVDLVGSNNVTVHVGSERTVVVRADDNLLHLVTTEVRAGALVIASDGSFTTKTPMSVDVTVPRLERVTLSGSGNVVVDGVHAKRFVVRLPGAGALTVTGKAARLHATLGGSGDLRLQGLQARDAAVSVSGAGRLQVHVSGALRASVSGAGAIVYSGNPATVTRSVTGTGSIVAR